MGYNLVKVGAGMGYDLVEAGTCGGAAAVVADGTH